MTTQHGARPEPDLRHNAAELAVAIGSIPAPAWFAFHADALDKLRAAIEKVLAGSSWREPDNVLRDCVLARDALTETAKLVSAALTKLDRHSRSQGYGAIHQAGGRAAAAKTPQTRHIPTAPTKHTLREVSIFIQRCLPLLDPTALQPCREQLRRAHSGLARANVHERGGVLGPPLELIAATGLVKQSERSLATGIDRLTASHQALRTYLIGAVGAAKLDRPRRPLDQWGKRSRVSRKLREARRTARETKNDAAEEKATMRRLERKDNRRIGKATAENHASVRDVLLASLGTPEPTSSKSDAED
ncbi:MAG: hypothetical protein ACREB0_13705 [Sphingopyxis sp.]